MNRASRASGKKGLDRRSNGVDRDVWRKRGDKKGIPGETNGIER